MKLEPEPDKWPSLTTLNGRIATVPASPCSSLTCEDWPLSGLVERTSAGDGGQLAGPACRFRQRRACPNPVIFGGLRNASELCGGAQSYQDVLVLRVSGFVFGRESLPCTGLLKDLAD